MIIKKFGLIVIKIIINKKIHLIKFDLSPVIKMLNGIIRKKMFKKILDLGLLVLLIKKAKMIKLKARR